MSPRDFRILLGMIGLFLMVMVVLLLLFFVGAFFSVLGWLKAKKDNFILWLIKSF